MCAIERQRDREGAKERERKREIDAWTLKRGNVSFFFGEASIVNSTLQNGIPRKLLATHGDDDAVNATVIVGVAVITHNYHTWIFTRCDISFLRDSSPPCALSRFSRPILFLSSTKANISHAT